MERFAVRLLARVSARVSGCSAWLPCLHASVSNAFPAHRLCALRDAPGDTGWPAVNDSRAAATADRPAVVASVRVLPGTRCLLAAMEAVRLDKGLL